MNLFRKIAEMFRKPVPAVTPTHEPEPDVLFPGLVTAKMYAAFKPTQRTQAVMIAGDAVDLKHYTFLKWCVENDPDADVQFAALKRLPNFKDQEDLRPFLQKLDQSAKRLTWEPYLSMALHRTGVHA